VLSDAVTEAIQVAKLLATKADEIERTRRFPAPVNEALVESGMLRMLLPKMYGGGEIEPGTYLRAVIALAKGDGSVAWNVFVANSAALIAPFLPEASARLIFDDPAALIAWGPPNGQGAKVVEGGYLINGTWDFASGCRQATWMGAHGPVFEADGAPRLNAQGKPLIRTWLFPLDQAERHDVWNPIGLRGTASDSYTVRDLFVPEAFSSTREHPEEREISGPLYAFTMQGLYAVGVAGVALGLARAMLEDFKILAAEKTPRGRPRLAEGSMTQADFARAEARVGSAEAYALSVLAEIYGRADDWEIINFEDRARVRLICSNAIQASIDAADWAHRAAGVSAIFPGSPFERRFRDIHTLSQQIQARAAHFEAVGQVLLGEAPAIFY
jgi:indole-3-acetate monooxygenase